LPYENMPETAAPRTAPKSAPATPPPAVPTATKGRLSKAFKSVVGATLAGSLLTTGVSVYVSSNWFGNPNISLKEQLIDTSALFAGNLSVWSAAMVLGAIGWQLGKYFDDQSAHFRPRAIAAGTGVALIAAAFSFPHGGKIHDSVHNNLTRIFNAPVEAPNPALQKSSALYRVPALAPAA